MSQKLHNWLTVLFKMVGGLGGAMLIGGVLFLLLSLGDSSPENWSLKHRGWNMLLFGGLTYGIAFLICWLLIKIEVETS